MWTFYILYSSILNLFYIGFTGDELTERLRRHNSNHQGFTGKKGDWEIKFTETYNTKAEAYQREQEVKKWKSHKLIEKLIGSAHSD